MHTKYIHRFKHTCCSESPIKTGATLFSHIPNTLDSSWAACGSRCSIFIGWMKKMSISLYWSHPTPLSPWYIDLLRKKTYPFVSLDFGWQGATSESYPDLNVIQITKSWTSTQGWEQRHCGSDMNICDQKAHCDEI